VTLDCSRIWSYQCGSWH